MTPVLEPSASAEEAKDPFLLFRTSELDRVLIKVLEVEIGVVNRIAYGEYICTQVQT